MICVGPCPRRVTNEVPEIWEKVIPVTRDDRRLVFGSLGNYMPRYQYHRQCPIDSCLLARYDHAMTYSTPPEQDPPPQESGTFELENQIFEDLQDNESYDPDIESTEIFEDLADPAISNETFDGPPPDLGSEPAVSGTMISIPHPGMWYIDEKAIPVHVPIQVRSPLGTLIVTPTGRFSPHNRPSSESPLFRGKSREEIIMAGSIHTGPTPTQVLHLPKDPNSSAHGRCGHELNPTSGENPEHWAVSQMVFQQYLLNDPTTRPGNSTLCVECIDLLPPRPDPTVEAGSEVSSDGSIYVDNTGKVTMGPTTKQPFLTSSVDFSLPVNAQGEQIIPRPEVPNLEDRLAEGCPCIGSPRRRPDGHLCGLLCPTLGAMDRGVPKNSVSIGDRFSQDMSELLRTGQTPSYLDEKDVPVLVKPGEDFPEFTETSVKPAFVVSSGTPGKIIGQNKGTFLVDFRRDHDGKVFRGLRQSRFVRLSDLDQYLRENPAVRWKIAPKAREAKDMPQPDSVRVYVAEDAEGKSNLPDEPQLFSMVRGEVDWQYFTRVPDDTDTPERRALSKGDGWPRHWVNTRADWYTWPEVYNLSRKRMDGSPVILSTPVPSPSEWERIKDKVDQVMTFAREHGLI